MFLYPDHAKVPAAVQERLDNFTKAIKEANNTKQAMQKCKAALETYILPKGVKLTSALTKSEIGSLITRMANSVANDIDFMWDYWLLLNAGFLVSTQFPSSLDNKSFDIPKKFKIERDQFVKAFNDGKITIVQLDKAFTNLTKDIVKDFKERGVTVSDILDSGAAGTIDSIRQMVVGLGITINAKKEVIDVIGNSLSEGQTQTEYFHQASHAIQALYAKSSDTSIPGYAGRKLSTIMEHIKLSATKDCGSTNGLKLKVKDKTFMWAIVGKYQIVPKTVINRAGIKLITDADNLVGKSVLLRSPLYCKAKDGICETCLNKQWVDKLHLSAGANIGLMSSTYITGVMTTLTLKKSHTGILLGQQKINLLDEIDSIYE